eukprot:GFYU01022546.1.p1 GENE.GFYU01022546.1~~GFYU01022546.1.p1  ORF type:complete len:152 (-),score=26.96 GFYU01022546.1:107-562(-)
MAGSQTAGKGQAQGSAGAGGKNYDKAVASLVGNGKIVTGAAVLSTASTSKNVIFAQRGVSLSEEEATAIAGKVAASQLHKDYVSLGGNHYLITQNYDRSSYGRCTNESAGGGIVVSSTASSVVCAVYTSALAAEAIPYVERFVDEWSKMGH